VRHYEVIQETGREGLLTRILMEVSGQLRWSGHHDRSWCSVRESNRFVTHFTDWAIRAHNGIIKRSLICGRSYTCNTDVLQDGFSWK